MENKSQEQKKSSDRHAETDTKINCWINSEASAHLTEVMQTYRLNKTEAVETILTEHGTSQTLGQAQAIMPQEIQEIFEKCKKKGCPASPYFVAEAQKALCVFPFEGKEPKILQRPIPELKACSAAPILISMARKRALEEDFQYRTEALTAQIDRAEEDMPKLHAYDKALREMLIGKDGEIAQHMGEIYRLANLLNEKGKANDKLTRKLQPMETYITKNEKVSNWRLHTANYLLRVLEERDALQTDNDFLTTQVKELSHDSLAEKCAFLTVQLSKKGEEIVGLKKDGEAKEALADKRTQTLNEVISKASSLFSELRQFVPLYAKGYADMIENFEGYLKTMKATPKDSLERFI